MLAFVDVGHIPFVAVTRPHRFRRRRRRGYDDRWLTAICSDRVNDSWPSPRHHNKKVEVQRLTTDLVNLILVERLKPELLKLFCVFSLATEFNNEI